MSIVKDLAKSIVRCLALIIVSPLAIPQRLLGSDGSLAACSQFLSLLPGNTGSYLRIAFYRMTLKHCDADCYIGFGTLFSQTDTQIHRGVYIGPQCNIGACCIEADTLLASGVHVMSGKQQHRFDRLDTPIRDQGGEFHSITIGRDCWIGNGSLIMADVGEQCVVGAGSVVTQVLEARSIGAGNPARRLRARDEVPE